MEPLVNASKTKMKVELSQVMEDSYSTLGKHFQNLIGRIITAVANATAISYGIDVQSAGPDVTSSLPESVRNAVEQQQRELTKKLVSHWNNPLCSELEFALQKRVSKEECRHLAFFPSEKQMESYVLLVQDPPDGAPSEHPQRKIRQIFLSLLYLVHVEDWKLVRSFIAAGGLIALIPHISHDNVGIRSQAIDIIHRITSSQYFDWFLKPKDHESKVLHQRFLQLSNTSFVQHLLLNAPGQINKNTSKINEASIGSFFSLQILAFWLSWVRKLYSQNGELRLSREILGSLLRWSQVDPSHVTSPEEIELATKVYEDFNRLPPADGVEGHHVELSGSPNNDDNSETTTKVSSSGKGEQETSKRDKPAASKLTPKQIADREKKQGNESFKNKNYSVAIQHYTNAIQADSTRSVLYSNRAACYLALAKASKGEKDDESKDENNFECNENADDGENSGVTSTGYAKSVVDDCNEAIRLHPTYVKAYFRRAQGFTLLSGFENALTDVDQAVALAKKELQGKPPKDRTAELKKSLRLMKDWKLKALNKRDAALRKSRGWSKTPGATLINSTIATTSTSTTTKPPLSKPETVNGIVASSRLGSGILNALLKREKWDRHTNGGDRSAPISKLEPDVVTPAEDGGSGTGTATDANSFINATVASNPVAPSNSSSFSKSGGSIPLKKKVKKSKKIIKIEKSTNELKIKQNKKTKIKVSTTKETKPCVIDGLGTVEPPRTAMNVGKVVNFAMKKDPSGKLLVEYYSQTFPPSKYRKVLKENINESILLSMIAVAQQLSMKSNHEDLEQHLKGLARVRRLESALMFLDNEPKELLKSTIEDMIGEEKEMNLIKGAFKACW